MTSNSPSIIARGSGASPDRRNKIKTEYSILHPPPRFVSYNVRLSPSERGCQWACARFFVAVEPRGQRRFVQVTARRTKVDFVAFVCRLLRRGYSHVRKVHFVLDNLNTHLRESFEEVLGVKMAVTVLRRIEFHYTPKHASWLNMAEIEIGVLQRQCLSRCAGEQAILTTEIAAWQRRRNAARCGIEWTFTRRDADRKLSRHYVS
jgi:DDE superfamily endonuclease